MNKKEFNKFKYDKEPSFDKNYSIKDVPCHYSISPSGTITFAFLVNEDGLPCFCEYVNGIKSHCNVFPKMESLKEWFGFNVQMFNHFCEWMEEYEKTKRKRSI